MIASGVSHHGRRRSQARREVDSKLYRLVTLISAAAELARLSLR